MKPPRRSIKDMFVAPMPLSDDEELIGPTVAAAAAAQRARIPQIQDTIFPDDGPAVTTNQLLDLAMNATGPMGGIAGATRSVAPKAAEELYHATSSAPFSKFLRSKMGQGSGGNRLGFAGYLTNKLEPEGYEYLKHLTRYEEPPAIITKSGKEIPVSLQDATKVRQGVITPEQLVANQQDFLEKLQEVISSGKASPMTVDRALNAKSKLTDLLELTNTGVADVRRPGSILRAELDVDPKVLLNYDKNLAEQTPEVQEIMKQVLGIRGAISPRNTNQAWDFSNFLQKKLPTLEGTKALEDAGIQGVTAQSSMSYPQAGKKTFIKPKNYAIFDPDRIRVLGSLGILGMLTGGMADGMASAGDRTTQRRR